jgi:hypothetical protein
MMCDFRFSTSYQFIQSVSKETRMENFWFDDPSNASMEEAVTAEIQNEKWRFMEEKETSQVDA